MLSEEGNPFERETALLESNNNREEVLLLYEAAEFMSEANWKQCINKIRGISRISQPIALSSPPNHQNK